MSVTWLGLMLLSPLVILLEETALCLTNSRYCLFNLYFINFCFNIYYLLTVPALHFCSFSKNLRCLIRLFIWDFSGVWMWPHVSFPLTTALILSRRFHEVVSLLFDCRNVFISFVMSSMTICWLKCMLFCWQVLVCCLKSILLFIPSFIEFCGLTGQMELFWVLFVFVKASCTDYNMLNFQEFLCAAENNMYFLFVQWTFL